jgi:hypothetical protein
MRIIANVHQRYNAGVTYSEGFFFRKIDSVLGFASCFRCIKGQVE